MFRSLFSNQQEPQRQQQQQQLSSPEHRSLTSPETVGSTSSSNKDVAPVPSLTEVNPSEVDALLAQELNQLSLKDRERTMEEIHGVYDYCRNPSHDHYNNHKDDSGRKLPSSPSSATADEKERLEEGLRQLQIELDETECDNKECYELALQQQSPLLSNKKFRIKFLYAEDHDPQKAALRLINYFDVATELYGDAALMRPITWNDLSVQAMQLMRSG
ncbi:MAG: hypothetical protein SGILL_009308, partial [Bacillariaceae sp.]